MQSQTKRDMLQIVGKLAAQQVVAAPNDLKLQEAIQSRKYYNNEDDLLASIFEDVTIYKKQSIITGAQLCDHKKE